MASILRNAAAAVSNIGMPSSFYSNDKANPVFQSLDKEIKQFMGFIKKKNTPGYQKPDGDAYSRPADTLFEIWNKYEPRLPKSYYHKKLLELGDFLVFAKEYSLAQWQCYDRYLMQFSNINVIQLTDVEEFKSVFFTKGLDGDSADLTFWALMGKSISMFHVVKVSDPKLQNIQNVANCLQILSFLRLVTQVILPKEKLCWLVYNGTIHIYSISRYMMSLGHSAKVLEYLLWACMCMETSVLLLTVKYLSWRSTLYTAVCQCYFDCKASENAESFARRGLAKIQELSQLEAMSSSPDSSEREAAFRHATVKMAIMMFKRSVYETRRRPKGLLRPKTRANLKDAQNLQWPRTPSEKLLHDIFDGSATQFLCILEALSDTNKRIFITSPPAPESEVEILDVYAELFMAAQEILAGGGGHRFAQPKVASLVGIPALAAIVPGKTLMEMAIKGEDGVTLKGAIKLVKLAFSFEQWEVFQTLNETVLTYLKIMNDGKYLWDEKCLQILGAMEKVMSSKKSRRTTSQTEDEQGEADAGPSQRSVGINDEMVVLAETLMSVIGGPFNQENIEVDLIVDAALFLWSKCKAVFQKYQTGSTDNPKYLSKMENPTKWVYILDAIQQLLCWCGISSVDPALMAEVVLRLGLVLESSAQLDQIDDCKSAAKDSSTSDLGIVPDGTQHISRTSVLSSSLLNVNPRNQLLQAQDILELGLKHVSFARQAVALTDGKSIADVSWAKELNKELFMPDARKAGEDIEDTQISRDDLSSECFKGTATAVWNTIKDLHLELILMYHRVSIKLELLGSNPTTSSPKPNRQTDTSSGMQLGNERTSIETTGVEKRDELLAKANKNSLSKALLYMQKASLMSTDGQVNKEHKKLLEMAVTCIQKAQVEEKRLYMDNIGIADKLPAQGRVPPPPILLSRTDNIMIFKPAPWKPNTGENVAWYRIFARNISGNNIKARLNDYFLPGTGEQVPYYHPELRISGLKGNERYVFAVAAYTIDGKLIGDGVGESTKPILASHPLPILTAWAFLSQISYQIGCYDIAKRACYVLWDYFIGQKPPPDDTTYTTSNEKDFKLTLLRLNKRILCLSSPVILRLFLANIFISVDIGVREGNIFCDTLCDRGPAYQKQIKRLKECEKMLVAIELAGWLNESNLALQAVVQCYGLVAPLIYYKIPSIPVFQILQRCHIVLQEIPTGLRQKRPSSIADSLHHMTACITFHMAKVLRNWGQKSLANSFNDAGRRLLAVEGGGEPTNDKKDIDKGTALDASVDIDDTTAGSINLQFLKQKTRKVKKGLTSILKENEMEGPMNEELKALEAHMLSMSKQVAKFKKRAKYLEFFVQVAQKALTEGLPDLLLEWCDDTENWLARRNEQIIGVRAFLTKQTGGTMTVTGDDPKKFAAAMVEYSKDKDKGSRSMLDKDLSSPRVPVSGSKTAQSKNQLSAPKPKRRHKYKALLVTNNMSEAARQAQEEMELKAINKIGQHLPDMYRDWHRKQRLRKICVDEMPFKCQFSIIQGLAHFNAFLHKLEKMEKFRGNLDSIVYKTNFLDQEWFVLDTAGTLIVGWEGGPLQHHSMNEFRGTSRQNKENTKFTNTVEKSREGSDSSSGEESITVYSKTKTKTTEALDLVVPERPKTNTTGIEIAAALTTGVPPLPMFTEPPVAEDTPRTYRSDASTYRRQSQKNLVDQSQEKTLLTFQETLDAISKAFSCFQKAIVLAHRGKYWTLLQNSALALWNSVHTALLRVYTPVVEGGDGHGLLTTDELRSISWKPLHVAADCLLDMMHQSQMDLEAHAAKAKAKGKTVGESFESWTGSILNEAGGASLKFEEPLDNQAYLNMRFIRRLVLRVLELLYYEQKWEKLVDLSLRFNALTNDRYAEQVIPLLVQAQRKLTARILELGGNVPPQPHFQKLTMHLNSVITARIYLTQQLELVFDKSNIMAVPAGAAIDPLGHGLYTSKDALKNVSVPLDVPYSLSVLYEAFDKSQYSARSLQHSRKLMILYLANQQNMAEVSLSRQPSKVDFISNTACPQPTVPPDISKDEYLNPSDVQTAPIPQSQLGIVLTSYEKTIEMLLAKNQHDLAAQAMHELGNLYHHANNLRSAYKWWCNALDVILNGEDVLHTWHDLCKHMTDISADLLHRCGVWGCLLAAIVTSNISQYILTTDLGFRTECCFLSGYLFKALFRSSLPHPLADRNYAMYEVGEGCEVTNLIPGVDLLSEKFRADGRQLVAALRWVIEELARGHHNLFVLPLLTLNQYFTTFVSRDLQRTVDGRILKCRVLADLGLFTEALQTLQRLLHGERLPHIGDSSFRQVESKAMHTKFDTSKPIYHFSNLKVLENVLDKRLSSSLSMLYGPHMTCHLSMVQAHLFLCIAHTIPVLPNVQDVIISDGSEAFKQLTTSSLSKAAHQGSVVKTPDIKSKKKKQASDARMQGTVPTPPMIKRFSGASKPVTLEFIKGTLLVIADQMVSTISDVLQENVDQQGGGNQNKLSAAELELVVLCKLEQAEIARQKHHAPMAARIVLSALKLIQNSDLFKKKKFLPHPPKSPPTHNHADGKVKKQSNAIKMSEPESSQFQFQNFQSRSRLDARLWLACRVSLVKSLMLEIRGMGDVKGSDIKVLQDLADCRQYCAEGLGESETCGDVEMQAEFLLQGAYLNIVEGKTIEHTISLLQDAINMLVKVPNLSIPGGEALATAILMRTDLEAVEHTEDDTVIFTERTLGNYLQAQTIILRQMEALGEKIEHYFPEGQLSHFSMPNSPLCNIYLPQCLELVQIKLRVGHAMARNAAKTIRHRSDLEPVPMWSDALGVLKTALAISQISMRRESSLEAELLFYIGKVERMLVYLGKYQARYAVQTLIEAIQLSHATDHNLGLMRQAYLEIALTYLYSGGLAFMKEGTCIDVISGTDVSDQTTDVLKEGKDSTKKGKKDKVIKSSSKEELSEQEKECRAAWLAIKCAASVANTQRNRLQLIGDASVTSQILSEKAQKEMPDFVALDLMADYVLGQKKKVYKNEIEEELAPLIDAQELKHVDTYEEQLQKAKKAAAELNWIQFLGYQTILQRLCSTSTIHASSVKIEDALKSNKIGDLGPDFDLGFISHAECDTTVNHDVVRSMLFSGTWSMRLSKMHTYLCENLSAYADCCAVYPPDGLELTLTAEPATTLELVTKSYVSNLILPVDLEKESSIQLDIETTTGVPLACPGSNKLSMRPVYKPNVSPTENEVTLQWYHPSLEEADPSRPDAKGPESCILLMYALSSKTSLSTAARLSWVQLSQLYDIHDRLAVLMQRTEVYLSSPGTKSKTDTVLPSPTSSTKIKKGQQKSKNISPKVKKDESLENVLHQCLDDITNLLRSSPVQEQEASSVSQGLPFTVSKVNIKTLEALFDPSYGATGTGTDLIQWIMKLFPTV